MAALVWPQAKPKRQTSLGRWLNQDPIGFDGGLNLYTYVGNNPIGLVDPSGLQPPRPGGRGHGRLCGWGLDGYPKQLTERQRRSAEAERILENVELPSPGKTPTIEFIVSDRLPHPTSNWGHTAIVIGDTAFSYGTLGMTVMPRQDYISLQSGRSSIGYTYEVSPVKFAAARDEALRRFTKDPGAWYAKDGSRFAPKTAGSHDYGLQNQCNTATCQIGECAGVNPNTYWPFDTAARIPKGWTKQTWYPAKR